MTYDGLENDRIVGHVITRQITTSEKEPERSIFPLHRAFPRQDLFATVAWAAGTPIDV